MIQPSFIRPKDRVYCISPASFAPWAKVARFVEILEGVGLSVERSAHTLLPSAMGYFSNTDERRIQDFQYAVNDPTIKVIWCMRGGYGSSRIVDAIDFSPMLQHPKWLIGYSDITILQLHLLAKYGIMSVHGGMAASVEHGITDDFKMLIRLLMGELFSCSVGRMPLPHTHQKTGECRGKLLGGNLSLLVHSIGTASEPIWEDSILFVEEVGEHFYAVDRMFVQLARRGVFQKIKGLVLGQFTQMKDTNPSFGMGVYSIVYHHLASTSIPVGFDFPFGHGDRIYPLLQGATYELVVSETNAQLTLKL